MLCSWVRNFPPAVPLSTQKHRRTITKTRLRDDKKWTSTKTTNSCHPRNQSAAKLKPNATWLPAFSYAWGRFHPFQRSVIGSENWCHSLNQSNAELRQVMTWLFTLSARFRQLAISHSILIGSLGHFPLCEFFVWIALVSCFFLFFVITTRNRKLI